MGTPLFEGVTPAAVGSLAVVALAVPLAVGAIHRLLPSLWYADPALPTPEGEAATGGRGRSWGRHRTRTGLVVAGLFRRAVRTPLRYAHVAYYLIVVGLLVVGGVTNPEVLVLMTGGALVLLGVWLAGGLFGLNPVGEEGAMLDQLVLSATPAATFVRARIVAGVVVGAPLVAVGTGLTVVGGLAPTDGLLVGALCLALTPVSAAAALGLGTLYPGTEPGTVLDTAETVPPETVAVVAHAGLTGAFAVLGVVGLVTDPGLGVRVFLLGTVGVGAVLLGDGGYRYAVAGVRDYGRERAPDPVFALELGAGLALVGLVAANSVSLAALAFLPLSGTPGFVLAFVGAYAGYAAVVATYVYGSGRGWRWLGLRWPDAGDLRVLGVGLAASFGVYAALVGAVTVVSLPVAQHSLGRDVAAGGPGVALVLVALSVLVVGPVEELLFRGVVQRRLAETVPESTAVGLAALVFALAHLPVYATAGPVAVAVSLGTLVVLGAVWGWVYARTGSVVPAALCHGCYNGALFGVAYVALL